MAQRKNLSSVILAFSIFSFSSISTFPFPHLLPSISIFLPYFLSPFCISSLPTVPTIALMAPLPYLPLSYLLKSPPTEHLEEMYSRVLEGNAWNKESRTWMAGGLGYAREVTGCNGLVYMHCYRQGREITPRSGWKNSLQHFCPEKLYFKVRRRKINGKMFHLWSVGYLILSGKNVRVHGCIHHCCYFMKECCYETSLPILHKSHFSDMWSLV